MFFVFTLRHSHFQQYFSRNKPHTKPTTEQCIRYLQTTATPIENFTINNKHQLDPLQGGNDTYWQCVSIAGTSQGSNFFTSYFPKHRVRRPALYGSENAVQITNSFATNRPKIVISNAFMFWAMFKAQYVFFIIVCVLVLRCG